MEEALHEIKKSPMQIVGKAFKVLALHPPTLQTSIYLSIYILCIKGPKKFLSSLEHGFKAFQKLIPYFLEFK